MTDRLLLESDVIKTIDENTCDNGQLMDDISRIMEDCPSAFEVVKAKNNETCKDSRFKEIRAVLDRYENTQITDESRCFMNELAVALYHEVNIGWLYKIFKVLNDPDIIDDAKGVYRRFLEEQYKED